MASITQLRLKKFVLENIVCRFGIPNVLVMDNGPKLKCDHIKEFCEGFHIRMAPISVAYPQTNSQTKAINAVILMTIKMRLRKLREHGLTSYQESFVPCTLPLTWGKIHAFFLEF